MLARLDAAQHFRGDRDARDDDVGALGVESGHLPPLLRRHVGEHVEDVLEVRARNVRRVHRARRENSLTREVDAGEVRERPARADELRIRANRGAGAARESRRRPRAASARTRFGVMPSR